MRRSEERMKGSEEQMKMDMNEMDRSRGGLWFTHGRNNKQVFLPDKDFSILPDHQLHPGLTSITLHLRPTTGAAPWPWSCMCLPICHSFFSGSLFFHVTKMGPGGEVGRWAVRDHPLLRLRRAVQCSAMPYQTVPMGVDKASTSQTSTGFKKGP